MGLFDKLKQGLGKTRESIKGAVDSVFVAFNNIGEDLYEELEEALIFADLGAETAIALTNELRENVKTKRISEPEEAKKELYNIISEALSGDCSLNLSGKPAVIMVIGVNGVGKTTSIGKMTALLQSKGKKVILAAADTFRAAAIDQLAIWADRNNVTMIRHEEGSDPAAVVFDACAAAKSRNADVLICDTAGRLHNKKNLMQELEKIYRVIKRELPESSLEVLLALDATTGQNAVNQAEMFKETADITGIVLTKLDGTAKGGIVINIKKKLNIPVKFIGVGEGIEDLQEFDPEAFAKALLE
ncbi:MAG: signal recognition particle-docking protein FtsY [Bacillota bacterium]|nr:signal recognition particle-docking protein FtsY [Bacillota bacterium]